MVFLGLRRLAVQFAENMKYLKSLILLRESFFLSDVLKNWPLMLFVLCLSYLIDWSYVLIWKIFFLNHQLKHINYENFFLIVNLALGIISFSQFFFFGAHRLPFLIAQREIDSLLLRPAPVLAQILSKPHYLPPMGSLFFAFTNILFFTNLTLGQKILFFLLTLNGAFLLVSFLISVGSAVFWLKGSELVCHLLGDSLFTFTTYPNVHYQTFFAIFFYTLFPAGWLIQEPLKLITQTNWSKLIPLILFTFFYGFLSFAFFQKGIRKLLRDG